MSEGTHSSMLMAQAEERCGKMSFEELVDEVQERLGIADGRQEGLMAMAQMMFENRPMVHVMLEEMKRRHGRLLDARKSERCEMEELKRQLEILQACLDREKQNALPALEESLKWKQKWEESKATEKKMCREMNAALEEAEEGKRAAQQVIEEMKRQNMQPMAVETAAEILEAMETRNNVLEEEKAKMEKQVARLTFELQSHSGTSIENRRTYKVDSPANSAGEVDGPFRRPCKELNTGRSTCFDGEGGLELDFDESEQVGTRQEAAHCLFANTHGVDENLVRNVHELPSSTVSSLAEEEAGDSADEQVMESGYCSTDRVFDASATQCSTGEGNKEEFWQGEYCSELTNVVQLLAEDAADIRQGISAAREIDAGSSLRRAPTGTFDFTSPPAAGPSAKIDLGRFLSVLHAIHEALLEAKTTLSTNGCEIDSAAMLSCTGKEEKESELEVKTSTEHSPRDLITSLGMAYNPEGGDIFQYKEPEKADPSVQEKYTFELRDTLVADLKHTLDLPTSSLPLCAVETAIAFLKAEVIHVDEARLDVIRTISKTIRSTADRKHTFKVSFLKLKAIIVEMSGEQRSGGNWSIANPVLEEIARSKDLQQRLKSSLVWLVVAWECMDLEAKKHLLAASEFLANAHWLVLLGRICATGTPACLGFTSRSDSISSKLPKKRWSWLFRSRH
uniref:Uncharacterized protein n=1 Tax=Picocystis salinarum TaxID=88271 RepID=A0A7S3UFA6_9CHLO